MCSQQDVTANLAAVAAACSNTFTRVSRFIFNVASIILLILIVNWSRSPLLQIFFLLNLLLLPGKFYKFYLHFI